VKGQAPWICDNCGKHRTNDTNHWFVLTSDVTPSDKDIAAALGDAKRLTVSEWREAFAQQILDGHHACGESCRDILIGRFFATGSFDIRKPAVVTYESRDVLDAALERAHFIQKEKP